MTSFAPITEIFPFENRLRTFRMPAVRLIGKSIRHQNEADIAPIPLFWQEFHARHRAAVRALPQIITTTIAWLGDYEPATQEYTYLICVICPSGTPVPAGLEYRDFGSMHLAHGPTSRNPPDAHSLAGLDEELGARGLIRGAEWCEFYPDPEASDCCVLFVVEERQ
jgi:hypothetical protein